MAAKPPTRIQCTSDTIVPHDHVIISLAKRAMAAGARQPIPGVPTFEWDVSGDCESPVYVERFSRPRDQGYSAEYMGIDSIDFRDVYHLKGPAEMPHHTWRPGRASKVEVQMWVRCRQCEPCRKKRAASWAIRAAQEIMLTQGRTWFCTFTFGVSHRAKALHQARFDSRAKGLDYDALPEKEKDMMLVRSVSGELTKCLKRLRKSGAKLRYLATTEFHKVERFPHFHVLLHEQADPIRYREIERSWVAGFSHAKLVDEGVASSAAAWYLCKYIAKEPYGRIRASFKYGSVDGRKVKIIDDPKCTL